MQAVSASRASALPEAVVSTVKSTAADAGVRLNSTLADVKGALSKVKAPHAPKLNLTGVAPKLPALKAPKLPPGMANFTIKGAWADALDNVQKRTGFNITDLKFVSGRPAGGGLTRDGLARSSLARNGLALLPRGPAAPPSRRASPSEDAKSARGAAPCAGLTRAAPPLRGNAERHHPAAEGRARPGARCERRARRAGQAGQGPGRRQERAGGGRGVGAASHVAAEAGGRLSDGLATFGDQPPPYQPRAEHRPLSLVALSTRRPPPYPHTPKPPLTPRTCSSRPSPRTSRRPSTRSTPSRPLAPTDAAQTSRHSLLVS